MRQRHLNFLATELGQLPSPISKADRKPCTVISLRPMRFSNCDKAISDMTPPRGAGNIILPGEVLAGFIFAKMATSFIAQRHLMQVAGLQGIAPLLPVLGIAKTALHSIENAWPEG